MVESRRFFDEEDEVLQQRRGTSFAIRKIVVVGDSGVGKTAIISRYISG
jgi:hypothetical protein